MTRRRHRPEDDSGYISRRQAAAEAGVHYNSIRAWERAGVLSSFKTKVGQREEVRIRVDDLNEVLARRGGAGINARTRPKRPEELNDELEDARRRIARLEGENAALRNVIERYMSR